MSRCVVYWFRNDLRLNDNVVFNEAVRYAQEHHATFLPIYCFDPIEEQELSLGFKKRGLFRQTFLEESLLTLQQSLLERGSDLFICKSNPERFFQQLVGRSFRLEAVYASKEATYDELHTEKLVKTVLTTLNVPLNLIWQSTLIHPQALSFSLEKLPRVFTIFRKAVEANLSIPTPVDAPQQLPALPPNFERLDFLEILVNPTDPIATQCPYQGGEDKGLERLNHYFWQTDQLAQYKQTRNGLLGLDYSSKFSPWLANGCLSPRTIYSELKRYESERTKNESTYWLFFELLWRDYFRFSAVKHAQKLFLSGGLDNKSIPWKQDKVVFQQWCRGKTGHSFTNAAMHELNTTGFMSNRARQNVASHFCHSLGLDWRWGAAYFESLLVDYDVCSNWGSWAYLAGVGHDPREGRVFNIDSQQQRYDPKGEYVAYWNASKVIQ